MLVLSFCFHWVVQDSTDLVVSNTSRRANALFETVVIQSSEGTSQSIVKGRRWAEGVIVQMPQQPDMSASLSQLVVGTICGGADGTSGITANPAVENAFD